MLTFVLLRTRLCFKNFAAGLGDLFLHRQLNKSSYTFRFSKQCGNTIIDYDERWDWHLESLSHDVAING